MTTDTRRRWPLWAQVLLAGLACYSLAHFLYSAVYFAWHTLGGDMLSAFPGPLMYSLTQRWPALAKDWIVPTAVWNYGPVLHGLTLPLVLVPTQAQAMRILLLADYALVGASLIVWLRLLFPERPSPWVTVGLTCIWLNYFPLLEAITGREVELLELWLITVGIWWLRRQRQAWAGAAFGVAAMTKFLPLIFLPYLYIKGFKRAFWVAAGTVLVVAGLTQWVLGFEHSRTFTMVMMDEARGVFFPAAYANQALVNVLYKTFTVFDMQVSHPQTLYPYPLRALGLALHLVVLTATGWFLIRWRRRDDLEIECALLAGVMILVPPHANTYYLVFLLPAISVGYAYLVRRAAEMGLLVKAAFVGAVVLSGFLVPMKLLEPFTGLPGVVIARIWQLYSLPAFGAILAVLVMAGVHRLVRTAPQPP